MKWLSVVLLVIMTFSCDNENNDFIYNQVETYSEPYYIQYKASTSFPYRLSQVTVTTEKGTKSFPVQSSSWSQTFGPVTKGFQAQIGTYASGAVSTQIYVCKGAGPFVLKANGQYGATYKIDF